MKIKSYSKLAALILYLYLTKLNHNLVWTKDIYVFKSKTDCPQNESWNLDWKQFQMVEEATQTVKTSFCPFYNILVLKIVRGYYFQIHLLCFDGPYQWINVSKKRTDLGIPSGCFPIVSSCCFSKLGKAACQKFGLILLIMKWWWVTFMLQAKCGC